MGYNYNDISKLNWCNYTPILPTAYDDSLSYSEVLHKVLYTLNNTIDAVNFIGNNLEAIFTDWIEQNKESVLLNASYNERTQTITMYAKE